MKGTEISSHLVQPTPLDSTEVTLLQTALSTVRHDVVDCPYISEAIRVLPG